MSTYQKALDDIKDGMEDLQFDQGVPLRVRQEFMGMYEIMKVLAARGQALEEWNHQAWMSSGDFFKSRLKDPR